MGTGRSGGPQRPGGAVLFWIALGGRLDPVRASDDPAEVQGE
ncbi:hypothetical protein [Actinoplanes xinjiangensis]|nr:hypothetical protein [Actinoplanes xinjiangensis]